MSPHLQVWNHGFFRGWWDHAPFCWCHPGALGPDAEFYGDSNRLRWSEDPMAGHYSERSKQERVA